MVWDHEAGGSNPLTPTLSYPFGHHTYDSRGRLITEVRGIDNANYTIS